MTGVPLDRVVGVEVPRRGPGASDSRRCMKDQLIKILGLDADATDEKILEALKDKVDGDSPTAVIAKALDLKEDASEEEILDAIKAAGEKEPAKESLEDRAKAEGKKLVSAEDYAGLKAMAERGEKAAQELHQAKFDAAYDKAVDEVRLKTSDEARERYQKLYEKAPEETIEILDGLPKLANTRAKGAGGDVGDEAEGVDAERAKLDKRVKARMADKGEDYPTALDAVLADEGGED